MFTWSEQNIAKDLTIQINLIKACPDSIIIIILNQIWEKNWGFILISILNGTDFHQCQQVSWFSLFLLFEALKALPVA